MGLTDSGSKVSEHWLWVTALTFFDRISPDVLLSSTVRQKQQWAYLEFDLENQGFTFLCCLKEKSLLTAWVREQD